ncbi:MAG: hypothetical protein KAI47_21640 [Deltaproteobacteria bacterium]|nr:hypothetical protein [Deltaproteobacteria bacterium]
MKRSFGGVLLACALVFVGCSDDSGVSSDAGVDGVQKDIGVEPDTTVDTAPKPDMPKKEENIGEGCTTNDGTCKPGSPTCIVYDQKTYRGICSRKCTPDDANTKLINEDDCGKGLICGSFRISETESEDYCLKPCDPSLTANPCPASSGQTCAPNSTQFAALDQAVCWLPACKDGKDCPVLMETPCKKDADCTQEGAGAFCEENTCALPGNCTPGGLCGPHTQGKATAQVGDACKSDKDCLNAGFCLRDQDGYPNGYCSIRGCSSGISDFACPKGSTCHRLFYGGFCHKSCDPTDPKACRDNPLDKGGDYECYAWNNLTIGAGSVSDTPVCSTVASQSCDSLGTTLDCSSLGQQGNGTHMSCRDRATGTPLTNPADPNGFCLDDTASGPFSGATDGGVTDGSGVDAGVPEAGFPDITVPEAGLPDITVPEAGLPDITVPEAGLPDAKLPDAGAPDVAIPEAAVPDAAIPEAAVPDITLGEI